jgi:hypothetical protein
MFTAQGLYENGLVKVKEPVPNCGKCDVIVIFRPIAYNVKQIKHNEEFLLSNPNLTTEKEKNNAIDSLLGICEGNTLTLNDIKTERLKKQ